MQAQTKDASRVQTMKYMSDVRCLHISVLWEGLSIHIMNISVIVRGSAAVKQKVNALVAPTGVGLSIYTGQHL